MLQVFEVDVNLIYGKELRTYATAQNHNHALAKESKNTSKQDKAGK